MNRSTALATALAAFGLFLLQAMFRGDALRWHSLPHPVRIWIYDGLGAVAALIVALVAAYFWLRPQRF